MCTENYEAAKLQLFICFINHYGFKQVNVQQAAVCAQLVHAGGWEGNPRSDHQQQLAGSPWEPPAMGGLLLSLASMSAALPVVSLHNSWCLCLGEEQQDANSLVYMFILLLSLLWCSSLWIKH